MKKLNGIIVNMLSPMNQDYSLDKQGVNNLVDYYIKNNLAGIWALGSAGEDISISQEYRRQFTDELNNASNDQIPAIVGLGNMSFEEIIAFDEYNTNNDFFGYHILLYDQKISDLQAVNYIQKIADHLKKPLWLYNNPKRGKLLSFESVKILSNHPNIQGIKVGGYNLTELTNSVSLENESFQVMAAGGGQVFQALSLGYKCHSTSDANCFPKLMNGIYTDFIQNKIGQSRKKQFDYLSHKSYLKGNVMINGEKSAEEKFICSIKGICKEYVNPSYSLLDVESKKTISTYIKKNNLI